MSNEQTKSRTDIFSACASHMVTSECGDGRSTSSSTSAKNPHKMKWKRDPLLLSLHVSLVAGRIDSHSHLYYIIISLFFSFVRSFHVSAFAFLCYTKTSPLFVIVLVLINKSMRVHCVFVGLHRPNAIACARKRQILRAICILSVQPPCSLCGANPKNTHTHARILSGTHADISSAYYAWTYYLIFLSLSLCLPHSNAYICSVPTLQQTNVEISMQNEFHGKHRQTKWCRRCRRHRRHWKLEN